MVVTTVSLEVVLGRVPQGVTVTRVAKGDPTLFRTSRELKVVSKDLEIEERV